jgi:replicative DNA helicase
VTLIDASFAAQFDRLPPCSVEAERCVLGSVLLDRDAFDAARPLLDRESFYQADHQIVWDVACDLYARGACDGLLVREELIRRQLLDEVGGVAYLGQILNAVPSSAHARHYAGIVAEKAKLRGLIAAANDALRDAYAGGADADAVARRLEAAAVNVRETGFVDSVRTLDQIVAEALEQKAANVVTRFPTGLTDLDDLCGGLPIGGLTYVAGRAGMGKSQLLKQVLRNAAGTGVGAGLVTVEESRVKVAENLLANESGVTNSRIVFNQLTAGDWEALAAAQGRLGGLPLYVDDAQRKLSSIEAAVRRMVRKRGCRVIGVDHLHLIDGETDANREQELTKISGGLKALFKDLGVAGVVAVQMNRGGSLDADAPPELHHLRGTGSLEQDGDLIVQLHRQDYYEWKKRGADFVPDHRLVAYVNKNKSGAVGSRQFYFDGDRQHVGDWNNGRGPFGGPSDPFEN